MRFFRYRSLRIRPVILPSIISLWIPYDISPFLRPVEFEEPENLGPELEEEVVGEANLKAVAFGGENCPGGYRVASGNS